MALFNFGKKKEEKPSCCCSCGCESKAAKKVSGNITSIKVLGAGCENCHKQYENVSAAVKSLNLDIDVEYITDMQKVMTYGVMSMPAIVVNDKIVSMGKVLKVSDVEKLLTE